MTLLELEKKWGDDANIDGSDKKRRTEKVRPIDANHLKQAILEHAGTQLSLFDNEVMELIDDEAILYWTDPDMVNEDEDTGDV